MASCSTENIFKNKEQFYKIHFGNVDKTRVVESLIVDDKIDKMPNVQPKTENKNDTLKTYRRLSHE